MPKRFQNMLKYRSASFSFSNLLTCILIFYFAAAMNNPSGGTGQSEDWIAIPLSRMTGTADLIVYGTVSSVKDSTCIFTITRILAGKSDNKAIEVHKIMPDKFASVHPAPYASGQTYLLFLVHEKNSSCSMNWKVMGIGGEGQMPVENGFIYFPQNNIEGLPFKEYPVNGVLQFLQRFEFSVFLNAIEEYQKCYHWIKNKTDNQFYPQKACDAASQAKYSNKSFIHKYLSVQTESRIPH